MKAWENYALISDGIVRDIFTFQIGGYNEAQRVAKAIYGDDAIAVDATYAIIQVGNLYHDGIFWYVDPETSLEFPCEVVPSEEQSIALLTNDVSVAQQNISANTTDIQTNSDAIDEILISLLEG